MKDIVFPQSGLVKSCNAHFLSGSVMRAPTPAYAGGWPPAPPGKVAPDTPHGPPLRGGVSPSLVDPVGSVRGYK